MSSFPFVIAGILVMSVGTGRGGIVLLFNTVVGGAVMRRNPAFLKIQVGRCRLTLSNPR